MKKDSQFWKEHYSDRVKRFSREYKINDIWSKASYDLIKKGIKRLIPPEISGKIILDLGAGTGEMSKHLTVENTVIAYDISRALLKLAKKKDLKCVEGDVYNYTFKEESFDLIVSVELIHLTENWKEILRRTVKLLKPRGELVLYSPNGSSFIRKIHTLFNKSEYKTLNLVKPPDLISTLKESTFRLEEIMYNYYPLKLNKFRSNSNKLSDILATGFGVRARKR